MDYSNEAEAVTNLTGENNTNTTHHNTSIFNDSHYSFYEYIYEYEDSQYLPLEEALPVTLTYSLTLLLGLMGNLLVIFSIAYYRRMRTTTNVFLFSLACADLLLLLICVPIKAARFLAFTWTFGEVLCKLVHYVQNVSMICSVLTLTCISLERGIAVVFPLRARTICTMRHAKIVVVLVWFLSFICGAPILIGQVHVEVGVIRKGFWCVKDFPSSLVYILYEFYMLGLMFILPLVVMVTTYVIICLKVWKFTDMRLDMRQGRVIAPANKERMRQDMNGTDGMLLQGEAKLTRNGRKSDTTGDDTKTTKQLVVMLVVVVVLYAICWGPLLIDNLLQAFNIVNKLNYGFLKPMRVAFSLMTYFNSCVNPIVYAFMSKNFRQSFKFAVCACLKGKAFVRAYRFSVSLTNSTRTSAMSNGRSLHDTFGNRDKSSSSGTDYVQIIVPQDDDAIVLEVLPH